MPVVLYDLPPILTLLVDASTVFSCMTGLASHLSFCAWACQIHIGWPSKLLSRSLDITILGFVHYVETGKYDAGW